MPAEPTRGTAKSEHEVPPGEGQPADEDVHARLARHGFFVANDFGDAEGDNALASTMLSVIQSMQATGHAGEQRSAEAVSDDTAGPSPAKPSPSS